MLSERVRGDEVDFTKAAIDALQSVPWAAPLLRRVAQARDLPEPEHKPLMFEVRFAFELHRAGVVAEYEYPTGIGGSSVDFRIPGSPEWLIEIVSIRTSRVVQQATRQIDSPYTGYGNDSSNPYPIKRHSFQMSTSDSNPRQRPEGELIRVQEKIGEKVRVKDGSPTKFPISNGAMHLIVVDMRGYLDGGGHKNAYRQIAYGAQNAIVNREWVGEFWQEPSGKREPIKGLFEASNTRPAAQLIQERIHFLGFINERQYREGEIRNIDPNIMHYFANPYLFSTEAKAEEAFASYPLRAKLTDA
jgi:hypothetical protein